MSKKSSEWPEWVETVLAVIICIFALVGFIWVLGKTFSVIAFFIELPGKLERREDTEYLQSLQIEQVRTKFRLDGIDNTLFQIIEKINTTTLR